MTEDTSPRRAFHAPPAESIPTPDTLVTHELRKLLEERGLQIEGLPMTGPQEQKVLICRTDAPQWVQIEDTIRLADVARTGSCIRLCHDIVGRVRVPLQLGLPPTQLGGMSV